MTEKIEKKGEKSDAVVVKGTSVPPTKYDAGTAIPPDTVDEKYLVEKVWDEEDDEFAVNEPSVLNLKAPANRKPLTTLDSPVCGIVLNTSLLARGVPWGMFGNVYSTESGRPKAEIGGKLMHLVVLREDGKVSATCVETYGQRGEKYVKKSLKSVMETVVRGKCYRFSKKGSGKTLLVTADLLPEGPMTDKLLKIRANFKKIKVISLDPAAPEFVVLSKEVGEEFVKEATTVKRDDFFGGDPDDVTPPEGWDLRGMTEDPKGTTEEKKK